VAYTNHGHHVPGTSADGKPDRVARCGGPKYCRTCIRDISVILEQQDIQSSTMSYSTPEEGVDIPMMAKKAIVTYINGHVIRGDSSTGIPIGLDEVYVVWFSKTLQNWKALVCTVLPDGMYYELTFNGNENELYVDAYKKINNTTLKPDDFLRK
jgi:hypothetical protein